VKHTLRVLDQTGDTVVAEWDTTDQAELAKAVAEYRGVLESGRMTFTRDDNGKVRMIEEFEPNANIIAASPVVGG
jgi:hypothetical protein